MINFFSSPEEYNNCYIFVFECRLMTYFFISLKFKDLLFTAPIFERLKSLTSKDNEELKYLFVWFI